MKHTLKRNFKNFLKADDLHHVAVEDDPLAHVVLVVELWDHHQSIPHEILMIKHV